MFFIRFDCGVLVLKIKFQKWAIMSEDTEYKCLIVFAFVDLELCAIAGFVLQY